MKIAVLADIHANYPALQAVSDHIEQWRPDFVYVAGDIVNRGPRSLDCLRFVQNKQQSKDWRIIRGNHENYVIDRAAPDAPQSGPQFELFRPVHFSYQQLNEDVSYLKTLPEILSLTLPDANEFRVVHASMQGNRIGIYPEMDDAALRKRIMPAPTILVVGHTHRPLIRKIDKTLVVNTGAAGLPFDQDTRASYAQLTLHNGIWQAEIARIYYDIEAAKRDFHETGFLEHGGPLARLILRELTFGISQLYTWTSNYGDPILKGEITMEQAVDEFLEFR
ncbi:MAG: metallophosphoesterase family protein [Chloroflexi bacterium]|nr:metallophosphoesterase family protein [Chloroflexota bacterium]